MKDDTSLHELMKNPAFMDDLSQAKTLDDAVRLLNSRSIALSQQELQYLRTAEDDDGFLSEESLTFVAGGAPDISVMQLLMPKIIQKN